MRSTLVIGAILLSACASPTREAAPHAEGAPLATGLLRRLESDDPSIKGGLGWTGTIKEHMPCAIYDDWVKVQVEGSVIWIPRERLNYVEIEPESH